MTANISPKKKKERETKRQWNIFKVLGEKSGNPKFNNQQKYPPRMKKKYIIK